MKSLKSPFIAVLCLFLSTVPAQATSDTMTAGAPDFNATDIAGHPVKLSDFRGKIVLLDFWATWCPPCRVEVPNLIDIFRTFPSRNFVILSVSLDRDYDSARQFVGEKGMNWLHIMDRDAAGRIADLYRVQYIPSTFLLDRSGRLAARDLRGSELKAKIGQLLQ